MKNVQALGLALAALGLAACGGPPARTQTTSTTSTDRLEGGGEVRRTSSERTEVQRDGAQSTDRTETTQSNQPPP
ncbi:MAG: hypothetical protein J0L92_37850 [Deltaproteobacteria bacterium]|nr:hypothetical protein [Deltaproteobacteria bacterium]